MSGRSFDVFSPKSAIDADALNAFAKKMEGKFYFPGSLCSDVTAGAMAASNLDQNAYSWEEYNWFISPSDIGGDPRFESLYEYKKTVKYGNGGYKTIAPSGSYYTIRPY